MAIKWDYQGNKLLGFVFSWELMTAKNTYCLPCPLKHTHTERFLVLDDRVHTQLLRMTHL